MLVSHQNSLCKNERALNVSLGSRCSVEVFCFQIQLRSNEQLFICTTFIHFYYVLRSFTILKLLLRFVNNNVCRELLKTFHCKLYVVNKTIVSRTLSDPL